MEFMILDHITVMIINKINILSLFIKMKKLFSSFGIFYVPTYFCSGIKIIYLIVKSICSNGKIRYKNNNKILFVKNITLLVNFKPLK